MATENYNWIICLVIVNIKTISTSFTQKTAETTMEQILYELGWQALLPTFKSNNIDFSTFQPLLAAGGNF